MFVIFHFNICLKRFDIPPTTRKQTPFNDAFVAKKYTRTKLPTSIVNILNLIQIRNKQFKIYD